MRACSLCSVEKPLTEFAKKGNGFNYTCKPCKNEYNRKHYEDNKEYYKLKAAKHNQSRLKINRVNLVEYLRQASCIDCGETDIEVLEFDHRDRDNKSGMVSRFLSYSWARIQKEIDKCDVRCANCHRKRTRRQLGWWTDTEN